MPDTTLHTPPQPLCLSSPPLHSQFLNIILPPQLPPACQMLLLTAVKRPQPTGCRRTCTQHNFWQTEEEEGLLRDKASRDGGRKRGWVSSRRQVKRGRRGRDRGWVGEGPHSVSLPRAVRECVFFFFFPPSLQPISLSKQWEKGFGFWAKGSYPQFRRPHPRVAREIGQDQEDAIPPSNHYASVKPLCLEFVPPGKPLATPLQRRQGLPVQSHLLGQRSRLRTQPASCSKGQRSGHPR